MDKDKSPGCLVSLAWIIAITIILSLLFACKTTKNTTVDTTIKRDSAKVDSSDYYRRLLALEKIKVSEAKSETDAVAQFMATNDSALSAVIEGLQNDKEISEADKAKLIEQLKRAQKDCAKGGTATVQKDGSFQLTGLSKFNLSLAEEFSKSEFFRLSYEKEFDKRVIAERTVTELTQKIETSKTVKPAFPWLAVIISFAAGWFISVAAAWFLKRIGIIN
jgi:hypothetical protein